MLTRNIFITGGAGYVGAVLVPKLLSLGYSVSVYDLMIYGEEVLPVHPNLRIIKGDLRDQVLLLKSLAGHDTVIHLACISNDPSFELNPNLGKSINLDAFRPLVVNSLRVGVERFIYASSSSVYGVKQEKNVVEDISLEPLTDYSRYKVECEQILLEYQSSDFTTITLRPATVCGYSPRQRLDVVVNILTNLAFHNRKITVFGGNQLRPNIHIADMVDSYVMLLTAPKEKVSGQTYNVGWENRSVQEIAETVRSVIGDDVELIHTPTDDNRSYHISSKKIKMDLGFEASFSINDAITELREAFEMGKLMNSLTDEKYFNIKRMQNLELS